MVMSSTKLKDLTLMSHNGEQNVGKSKILMLLTVEKGCNDAIKFPGSLRGRDKRIRLVYNCAILFNCMTVGRAASSVLNLS